MTDHPRFSRVTGGPDSAHRHYHGGKLVEWVFRLLDSAMAERLRAGTPAHGDRVVRWPKLGLRPRTVVGFGLALVALYFGGVLLLLLA